MSEQEFRHTTPRYFYFRQKGFERLQVEKWERARVQAFYSFLPHTKKNALKKPENLFALPGESTSRLPEYNDEQRAAIARHMEAVGKIDLFAGETIKPFA